MIIPLMHTEEREEDLACERRRKLKETEMERETERENQRASEGEMTKERFKASLALAL